MGFYRLATEDDFNKKFEVNMDHFQKYLPEEIETLIESGKFNQAVSKLRQLTGRGCYECRKYCSEFQAFFKAKQDFLNGKPVFTDY